MYTYAHAYASASAHPPPCLTRSTPSNFQRFASHTRARHAHTLAHDARSTGTNPRRSCASHPSPPTHGVHITLVHNAPTFEANFFSVLTR